MMVCENFFSKQVICVESFPGSPWGRFWLDCEDFLFKFMIHLQDYTIQQLERRISRMQGEHSNEELMNLEKRQHELQEELNEKNNIHSVLIIQVKRLQVAQAIFSYA